MSYCFRMCLTNNASNRVKITAPVGYSSEKLELLRREMKWATHSLQKKLTFECLFLIRKLPNSKIDLNSGQFSENCSVCGKSGG